MIGKILINSNNNVNDKVAKTYNYTKNKSIASVSSWILQYFFLRTAALQNACARLSICSFDLLVTHLCKSICNNKDGKLHARHTVSYTRNSFLTEAGVLKKFAKFTEKQLCSSLLGPQLGSFLNLFISNLFIVDNFW